MIWFLAVVAVFLIFIVGLYNNLRTRKNQVSYSQSSVDVLLKKRHDLVPNLVETVEAYASHEQDILMKLVEARSAAVRRVGHGDITTARVASETELTQRLGQTLAIAEAYPDLKANKNFLHLQHMLSEVEEQISAARRFFNAAVNDYNNAVDTFPSSMMANIMNYQRLPYFSIPEIEKQVPTTGLS